MDLTLADYFKLHGEPQGPSRAVLLANAEETVRRWNLLRAAAASAGVPFMNDQISGNPVASGYRPAGANASTGGSTASKHLTCEALDHQDIPGTRPLALFICRNLKLCEEIGLWFEDFRWTAGTAKRDPWCHGQIKPPGSGKRIYIPYADTVAHPPTDPDFYARHGVVLN